MAQEPPEVSFRNVSLEYKIRKWPSRSFCHTVLSNINVDIIRGETLGVVGRNGSGKSSLLRIAAGIMTPTTGDLWIRPGASKSLMTLGVGFRPDLSGRDNALLSLVMQGQSRTEARYHLPYIKEFAEIGEYFDQPVKTYSNGMRSRLAFATAVISSVDILLVDETLSVGDLQFRKKAEATMTEKLRGEKTVIFVSHSTPQVQRLCDRAILLESGEIISEGLPREVSEDYALMMKHHAS